MIQIKPPIGRHVAQQFTLPLHARPAADIAPTHKAKLSAEAAARSELARLNTLAPLGHIKSWADVEAACPKLNPVPSIFRDEPFTLDRLSELRAYHISTAAARAEQAAAALIKRNEEIVVTKQNVKVEGVEFRPQQRKAIDGIIAAYQAGLNAVWVPLGTGLGKTFIAGGVLSWFKQQGLLPTDHIMFPAAFYFTRKQVRVPTAYKLSTYFKLTYATDERPRHDADIYISHYNALTSRKWSYFFRAEQGQAFGNVTKIYTWVPREKVVVIVLDEVHDLKKVKSARTKRILGIARAAQLNGYRVFWICMSATNATVLDDTRLFNYLAGYTDENNSTAFLSRFLSPKGKPSAKIKAQMSRYIDFVGKAYVRPPNDPRKFKNTFAIKMIDFPSPESEEFYRRAEEDYIEAIEATGGEVANLQTARFTLFRAAAEYCMCEWFVESAFASIAEGRSVLIAVDFKRTLLKCLAMFAERGIGRDQISIAKGPDRIITPDECFNDREFAKLLRQSDDEVRRFKEENDGEEPDSPWFFLSKKDQQKVKRTRLFNQQMVRAGETRAQQVHRTKWLEDMELGIQSDEARNNEVQRFIRNETRIFIYTADAGGTGIDANDVVGPANGGFPRDCYTSVAYYGEQWVQKIGRHVRINDMSDSRTFIGMFNNSIQSEHVLPLLANRLDSMSAMTGGTGDLEEKLMASIKRNPTKQFKRAADITVDSEDMVVAEGDGTDDEDDDDDED
jgi:hypothetical protein